MSVRKCAVSVAGRRSPTPCTTTPPLATLTRAACSLLRLSGFWRACGVTETEPCWAPIWTAERRRELDS